MLFSIHTFQLRTYITNADYKTLKEHYKNENCFFTDKKKKKITKYQSKGIRIELHKVTQKQRYKNQKNNCNYNLDIIVNLQKLLHDDIINIIHQEDLQKSINEFEEILLEAFTCLYNPLSLMDFYLHRVDLCTNINLGTEDNVMNAIAILNKNTSLLGFHINEKKYYSKRFFKALSVAPLENLSQGISLNIYNKAAELRNKNYEAYDNAAGILRFEIVLHKRYIQKIFPQGASSIRDMLVYFSRNSKELITQFISAELNLGVSIKFNKSCNYIADSPVSDTISNQMIAISNEVQQTHSLYTALSNIFPGKRKKQLRILKRFSELGLSPIPIAKNRKGNFLPSLRTMVTSDTAIMEQEIKILEYALGHDQRLKDEYTFWLKFYEERGVYTNAK